jgi:hypothetical protein
MFKKDSSYHQCEFFFVSMSCFDKRNRLTEDHVFFPVLVVTPICSNGNVGSLPADLCGLFYGQPLFYFIPNLTMSIADSSQIATGSDYARNYWNYVDMLLADWDYHSLPKKMPQKMT